MFFCYTTKSYIETDVAIFFVVKPAFFNIVIKRGVVKRHKLIQL